MLILHRRKLIAGAAALAAMPGAARASRYRFARPNWNPKFINHAHFLARDVRFATLGPPPLVENVSSSTTGLYNIITGEPGAIVGTILTAGPQSAPWLGGAWFNSATGQGVMSYSKGIPAEAAAERTYLFIGEVTALNGSFNPQVMVDSNNQTTGSCVCILGSSGNLFFSTRNGGFNNTFSTINLSVNVPYAIAVSWKQASGSTNFVVKRLDTNAISTSVTSLSTAPSASSGTANLNGNSGGANSSLQGYIAAAAWTRTYAALSSLVAWANDPWAFWYSSFSTGELFAQSAPSAGGAGGLATLGAGQ